MSIGTSSAISRSVGQRVSGYEAVNQRVPPPKSASRQSILNIGGTEPTLEHEDSIEVVTPDARHKGYGTKAHTAAVAKLRPTPINRVSFKARCFAEFVRLPEAHLSGRALYAASEACVPH